MTEDEKFIDIIETISARLLRLKMQGLSSIAGLELSASHFQYISVLDKLGKTSFTELAEKLQISKPAVTAFIGKLLKQKIVLKTQSDADRRFYFIELTDKGKQIVQVYHKALQTFADKLKGSMTAEEFKQLVHLIEKGL